MILHIAYRAVIAILHFNLSGVINALIPPAPVFFYIFPLKFLLNGLKAPLLIIDRVAWTQQIVPLVNTLVVGDEFPFLVKPGLLLKKPCLLVPNQQLWVELVQIPGFQNKGKGYPHTLPCSVSSSQIVYPYISSSLSVCVVQ